MNNLRSKQEKKRIRNNITLLLVFSVALILSGCASISSPVGQGVIVTNVYGPIAISGNVGNAKVGYSKCVNILGLVAVGDASINAAMKQGEISKIHHVDNKFLSVLFFFAKHTTIVYGE